MSALTRRIGGMGYCILESDADLYYILNDMAIRVVS